jgi:hypothetical protein
VLKLGEKRQAYDVKYSCARAVSALILFDGSTCRHASHTRTTTNHSSRRRPRRYCHILRASYFEAFGQEVQSALVARPRSVLRRLNVHKLVPAHCSVPAKLVRRTVWLEDLEKNGFRGRGYLAGSSRRRPSDFATSAIFLSPTTERPRHAKAQNKERNSRVATGRYPQLSPEGQHHHRSD